jgi:hypothetical protein
MPPPPPPQPDYTPYPAQGGYTGPRPSKTMAGWALGLAIIPSVLSWLISIALAISVIRDSRDGLDHGQKMAKAALVIVGVWLVVAVVVIVALVTTSAERDETGRVTDGGRASVLALRVGDCLPEADLIGEQRTVELVTCSKPHQVEVFAVFDLEGEFTTAEEVGQLADAGCFDRFEAYVGVPPEQSSLNVYDLVPPTKTSFRQDPSVSCLLIADDPLTGTMKGSKR